ncbi:unnamed protein product [Kuraishia capsulata CBS 1993]|uniref:Anaphase-promoting complex subunit 5 n=1 Tax=Kuraishia capsulata CBS 1993 TaxID=1382522 RepID=W6MUK4_9ASCO|nr:uncharacterized protein KUCA_T00001675001 [Kuraishia capsulata CBS 1993]CDK25705.1 unnamed protein product [Kuraishia capsulata CBS 1993]
MNLPKEPHEQRTKLLLTPALSPARIGTLALISLYCFGRIPAIVVPPVMSVVVDQIDGFKNGITKQFGKARKPEVNEELVDLIDRLSESIDSYFSRKNDIKDDTAKRTSDVVTHAFLSYLWSVQNMDMFYDLIHRSSRLLLKENAKQDRVGKENDARRKQLAKTSYLGKFVYNVSVNLRALEFDETVHLWHAFVQYREPTRAIYKPVRPLSDPKNRDAKELDYDIRISSMILKNANITDVAGYHSYDFAPHLQAGALTVSEIDLSDLLDYQIFLLEAYGTPTPPQVRNVLSMMSASSNLFPSLHYVSYLEYLNREDYENALFELHRYFDYMMSNDQRVFYHYALVSLATLESHFGNNREALRAIDESISVAREHQDMSCLSFLLTWLIDFMRNKPELYKSGTPGENVDTITQTLKVLNSKTKEVNNLNLQAVSCQFEALQAMADGEPMSKVMNNLIRASYILLSSPWRESERSVLLKTCDLQIANWSRIGISTLSNVMTDVAADTFGFSHNLYDEAHVLMRRANAEFLKGNIKTAFEIMADDGSSMSNVSLGRIWSFRKMLFTLSNWICKGRLHASKALIDSLKIQVSEVKEINFEAELIYLEVSYLQRVGDSTAAHKLLSSQFVDRKCYDIYWLIEYEILYAAIIAESSTAPSRGLSILLNALNLAYDTSLVSLSCKAMLTLVELLLAMDEDQNWSDCKDILYKTMPSILQVDQIAMIAKGFYLLAVTFKCKFIHDREEESLNQTLRFLEHAVLLYKKSSDLGMLEKCFDLETRLAQITNHAELIAHAQESTKKLISRKLEEMAYCIDT